LPSAIQLVHALENHEHTVCVSKTDTHIHANEFDCDIFHRPHQTLGYELPSTLDVIPTHYYTTTSKEIPQVFLVVFQNKKNPRGPPFFIV